MVKVIVSGQARVVSLKYTINCHCEDADLSGDEAIWRKGAHPTARLPRPSFVGLAMTFGKLCGHDAIERKDKWRSKLFLATSPG